MERRQFIKSSLMSAFLLPTSIHLPKLMAKEAPFVVNAGIPGNTSADILARIEQDCLAHHPDLTILLAGTNDRMNSRALIALSQYEQNMRSVITKILDMKSQLILMNTLPAYEPYLYTRHDKSAYEPEGYAGRKAELNVLIKNLADEYHLTFLDMHHIFETIGNIGTEKSSLVQNEANSGNTDGVHPTPDGYRVMAVAVYECIVENRLPCQRVVCFGDSITAGTYPFYLKKLLKY